MQSTLPTRDSVGGKSTPRGYEENGMVWSQQTYWQIIRVLQAKVNEKIDYKADRTSQDHTVLLRAWYRIES